MKKVKGVRRRPSSKGLPGAVAPETMHWMMALAFNMVEPVNSKVTRRWEVTLERNRCG